MYISCNSLIPFHLTRALSWWFKITSNNKTYLSSHVMYSIFLPTFNQIWIFLQTLHTSKFSWHTFINVPSIKFHGHPPSGSEGDKHRWMDKHDDANMSFPMAMQMHITKDYSCSHKKDIHGWLRGNVWDTMQAVVYGQENFPASSHVTFICDH